jgi:AcrR family transcriptional regulator/transposase-like protein
MYPTTKERWMMRDVAPADARSARAGIDADVFPVTPAPEADALEWLWRRRYAADGHTTICQTCGRPRRFHRVAGRRAYACDHCGRQIYPTAATLFRGSVIPLEKWFAAAAAIYHDPSLPPARLAERLDLPPRTAARMRRRIVGALAGGGGDAALLADIAAGYGRQSGTATGEADARGDTLDRIRAAATRVIARRGMSGTRLIDIAREAGVSPAIIHYYFKNREAVLLAALQWATERWQTRLGGLAASDRDPVVKLRELIDSSVPVDPDQRDEYFVWLDAWVGARTYTRFLPACTAISRYWTILVAAVLTQGETTGVFRLTAPPSEVAQRFVSLSNDLGFRCVVGYEELAPAAARRILARFTAEQVGLESATLE